MMSWEKLKPLVYQLYIEESMSFSRLKPFIQEELGVAPTVDQFKIRVRKWGFKKNTARSERCINLASSNVQRIGTRGKVVKETMQQSWEQQINRTLI